MTGKIFIAAVLVAASIAIPAAAQQASSRGSDYGQKKVCKVEGVKGSRLGGKRTCRTQAEWDELARENRTVVERIQQHSPACLMGSNDPAVGQVLVCSGDGP
jgi:hypothetical protein